MTVAAVKVKAKTSPAKALEAPPPAVPSRRRGVTPLTPLRQDVAKRMTKLADQMQKSHPDMLAHQHVRDAARMLRMGHEEAAQRHLRAAELSLSPQSLMRHGLHTDDAHIAARQALHGVNRHLLLVKDIVDIGARNQENLRRDSYGDDSTSNPPPRSPVQADPNAGYGPGALAQKPTARQPPGNQALNAPNRSSSGGSDPNVADPVGTQPRGSKQFAYGWDDVARVIELVGPHGYIHGWIFVGIPAAGSKVTFASGWHATGTVESADKTHVHVRMADGTVMHVPHNGKPGPGTLKRASEVPKVSSSGQGDTRQAFQKAKTALYQAIQARQANPGSAKLQANETAARRRFETAQEAHDRARGMPVLTRTGTAPDGTVTAVDQHGTEHKISLDKDGSLTITRNGETATMPNAGEDPERTARTMAMYMAQGRKDQTGAKAADRLTVIPDAAGRQEALQGLTSGELRAADAEFARRAALLGKPGQQSRAHKAVAAEMQKRGLSGGSPKPKAAEAAPKERPNTIVQPDPKTGELREYSQKETAEAAGRYATTLRPGSAERAEIERQAMDIARGGPTWQRMKEDADTLRPLVGKPTTANQAGKDLSFFEVQSAYQAAHGRQAPKSLLRQWAFSGPSAADKRSAWYQAGVARKGEVQAQASLRARLAAARPDEAKDEAAQANARADIKAVQQSGQRAAAAKAAAAKPKAPKAPRVPAPRKSAADKLSLISERMSGPDKTSGEMKAGDMLQGHQAISPAPAGIIGGTSDPWWMAGPHGSFALSVKGADGQRQLIPWSADKQREAEEGAVKAAAQYNRYGASYGSGFQQTLAKAVASRQHYEQLGFASSWDNLARVIELSAQTAALERTPAPIGKPGGPGLYHVKGLGHADYFQQVRNGLMKRGVPEGRAHAMTWDILRRWAAGGGHVHPEVQAAARKALEQEAAASAKAHAHAVSWDDVARVIDMATVIDLFNPDQLRVAAGNTGGGQFAPAGGAGGQPTAQQGKAPAKQPAAPKPTAHQLHVAHVAHVNKVSTQKAELLVTAQNDKAKAAALIQQRNALAKALASAGGKTSKGQAGAKTSSTAKTKSTAPAAGKSAGAPAAAGAKTPSSAPAAPKKAAASGKAPAAKSASGAAAAPKAGSAAAIKAQIGQLNLQISALLQAAAQASAQAAKIQ